MSGMAERGRLLLDGLSLDDELGAGMHGHGASASSKRLAKRQISDNTYNLNTPGVYDVKLQRVDFVGARKPGIVPSMWSAEEDEMLRNAVEMHGEKNWRVIAEEIPGRNHLQCLQRWKKALRPGLVKGHWSKEEDQELLDMIKAYTDKGSIGSVNWAAISQQIEGRNAKQCRERWFLNLDPAINRGPWTADEDRRLLELAAQCGGRWSLISKNMVGRTENAVKTRYHSLQRQEARGRNWAVDEDLALINASLTFGRVWSKIVKQLPGRSAGQVKKRFAVLAQTRPKLVQEVQALEERLAKGLYTPPVLAPTPVVPTSAQYLASQIVPQQQQQQQLQQQQQQQQQQMRSPSSAQMHVPRYAEPNSWGAPPAAPVSYYANPPSAPGPANVPTSAQQSPARTKGLGQRYGSSLSFLDNVLPNAGGAGDGGMPPVYQGRDAGGLRRTNSQKAFNDLLGGDDFESMFAAATGATPGQAKKLQHQDTTNVLQRILQEGPAGGPQQQQQQQQQQQNPDDKGLKHYGSSWGSMGGGDLAFLGGITAAPDTTMGTNLQRANSSKIFKSVPSNSNWGALGIDSFLQ